MTESADYEIQREDTYYRQDHAWEFEVELRDGGDWPGVGQSVLYVGCGRGDFMLCEERGGWVGCDFNAGLVDLWRRLGLGERCLVWDARRLPLSPEVFDWTFSVDFLEHVAEEDVELVATKLRLSGRRGLHVVHASPVSSFKGWGGKNLHPLGHWKAEHWEEVFPWARVTQSKRAGYLVLRW